MLVLWSCTILCAQVDNSGSAVTAAYRCTTSPRLTGGFVITSLTHAGGFGVTPQPAPSPRSGWGFHLAHRLWCVTTSSSRVLHSYISGPAWGLWSRPATISACVINIEHINQLSRFHAQKLSVLNFVRFDQALYFFGKKLFVKKILVITLFVTHKFKYPVYLGASFVKPFLLHMIILVWLRSLFVYYTTICTILT